MANWIFQGNPARFDVTEQLEARVPIKAWSITRHREDMQAGDRAALWVSGPDGGVFVLGEVTGQPIEKIAGEGWPEANQGQTMTFAALRLDDFLIDEPITRAEVLADPRFASARIITQPQADRRDGSPSTPT